MFIGLGDFTGSRGVGQGFPGGTSGKELACQCRRHKRHAFDPWVRKIPLEEGVTTHSCMTAEKSHGQKSLAGYRP